MAAAAFQEFSDDRQGAYVAVNAAKTVAQAEATLMRLRRAPIVKIAAAAFQEFGEDRQGASNKVNKAKSVDEAKAIV